MTAALPGGYTTSVDTGMVPTTTRTRVAHAIALMAGLAVLLLVPVNAQAALLTYLPMADGVQTSSPGAWLRKSTNAACSTFTATNLYDAIDEGVDPGNSSCTNEVLQSYFPTNAASYVEQRFELTDQAGAWTTNWLEMRYRICSTTGSDPDVTFSIYRSSGTLLVRPWTQSSIAGCGSSTRVTRMYSGFTATKADLDGAYVVIRVDQAAGTTQGARIIAFDMRTTSCTANLCGLVRANPTSNDTVWAACPAAAAVTVRVNGINPQTVACDANGEFAYTAAAVPANAIVTAYMSLASQPADKGVSYLKASGNGNTVRVYQDRASMQSAVGTAVTNANINMWDGSNAAAWIPVDVTGTALAETSPITLQVLPSNGTSNYDPSGDVTVSSFVTQGWARLDANTLTLTSSGTGSDCSGDPLGTRMPYCTAGNVLRTQDGSTLTYTGSGDAEVPSQTYSTLILRPVSGSPSLVANSTLTILDDFILGGGAGNAVLDPSKVRGIDVIRDFIINAGSSFSGPDVSSISVARHLTGAGTYATTGSGSLTMRGSTAVRTLGPTVAGTSWSINNLNVSTPGGTASTVRVGTAGAGSINVGGAFTVGLVSDTAQTTFDDATNARPMTVTAGLDITSQGAFQAPASRTITLNDDFTNSNTFTSNGGTVDLQPTFDGTARMQYAAATSFGTLSVTGGGRVEFDDAHQTNATTLNVNGSTCVIPNRATLASTTFGSQWDLNVTGTATVSNAAVQDSNAIVPIVGSLQSLDGGNNTNWTFNPTPCLPAAPNGFLTNGATNPTGVVTDNPVFSFVNQYGQAIDQERTQVVTSLPDNVVGLWHFDGNANDAIGTNNGTLLNGATASTPGHPNLDRALVLDGVNDVASVPHVVALMPSAFTVEAWFSTTSLNSSNTNVLVTKGANASGCVALSTCTYSLEWRGASNQLCFVSTSGALAYTSCGSSLSVINDGQWHHVAGTFDASRKLQLYVDGVAVPATSTAAGAANTNTSALLIGAASTSGLQPFPGSIDDVQVSSVARSSAEILGYFNTMRPHYTVLWDTSPTDTGNAITSCNNATRCADRTYAGLYLINDGARYYARAKVRLVADGVWSDWGSDWFETSAGMTVSASAPTLALGAVTSGLDVVGTTTITVTTDNFMGYSLLATWNANPMRHTVMLDPVADFVPTPPNPTSLWPAGSSQGFGITVLGATQDAISTPRMSRWGAGTDTLPTDFVANRYAGLSPTAPVLLHRRETYDEDPGTVDVAFRINVPSSQRAGAYSGTVVFTGVPNP